MAHIKLEVKKERLVEINVGNFVGMEYFLLLFMVKIKRV